MNPPPTATGQPLVKGFFDPATFTISYVVSDPESAACAVIDPVLDYEARAGRTTTASADAVCDYVRQNGLEAVWIIDSHVHADHLTALPYVQAQLGGRTVIGSKVGGVQAVFAELFNAEPEFPADGSQWDCLVSNGERLPLGGLEIEIMETPGHTPACSSFLIGDAVFVGDTMFMPDYGTARCDFPGGDAATLFRSIRRILELPPKTRIFTCHDYGGENRDFAWESTVADQRANSIHVGEDVDEKDFVAMRQKRDAGLSLPDLILPAVQINMRGGVFPPPADNGVSYIRLPLNKL